MKSFDAHLTKELQDPDFKVMYEAEKELIELAVKVAKSREKKGLSQTELAKQAHVTQQQVSKIEQGVNCNVTTLFKVLKALNLKFSVTRIRAT